jgi:hypothetical protein
VSQVVHSSTTRVISGRVPSRMGGPQ